MANVCIVLRRNRLQSFRFLLYGYLILNHKKSLNESLTRFSIVFRSQSLTSNHRPKPAESSDITSFLGQDENGLGNNDQLFSQHSRRRKAPVQSESSELEQSDDQVTPIERLHGAARLQTSGYLRVVDRDTEMASKHGIAFGSEGADMDDDDEPFSPVKPHADSPSASSTASQPHPSSSAADGANEANGGGPGGPAASGLELPPLDNRLLYSMAHELLDPEVAARAQRQLDADMRDLALSNPDDDVVEFAPPELLMADPAPAPARPGIKGARGAVDWYDINEDPVTTAASVASRAGAGRAASRRQTSPLAGEDEEDEGAAALFRDEEDELGDDGGLDWDEPLVELQPPPSAPPEGLELLVAPASPLRARPQLANDDDADVEDQFMDQDEQGGAASSFQRILQRENERRAAGKTKPEL